MKTYTKDELAEILRKHQIWLNHAPGGKRADFHGNDLRGADLSGANLTDAIFSRAELSRANLTDAYLTRAVLSDADLSGANLTRADLFEAHLERANLTDANLTDARLVFNSFYCYSIKGAPIYQVANGLGLENETLTLYAKGKPEEWSFHTASFRGTRTQLEKEVFTIHKGTKERANYFRAIEYLWQTALSNA